MSDWRRGYNAFGIISCSKGVLGENNCMGSMYKLENMGDTQITKDHTLIKGIYIMPGMENRKK
jgi:hypothetical protein